MSLREERERGATPLVIVLVFYLHPVYLLPEHNKKRRLTFGMNTTLLFAVLHANLSC